MWPGSIGAPSTAWVTGSVVTCPRMSGSKLGRAPICSTTRKVAPHGPESPETIRANAATPPNEAATTTIFPMLLQSSKLQRSSSLSVRNGAFGQGHGAVLSKAGIASNRRLPTRNAPCELDLPAQLPRLRLPCLWHRPLMARADGMALLERMMFNLWRAGPRTGLVRRERSMDL